PGCGPSGSTCRSTAPTGEWPARPTPWIRSRSSPTRSSAGWPSARSATCSTTTATCIARCSRCRTSSASWSPDRAPQARHALAGTVMTRVLFDAAHGPGAASSPGPGARVTLDERRSHHLVRVLRLRAGESVEAFDGAGRLFAATIAEADPKRSVLLLGERLSRETESPLSITLAQCLSSAERMDWTIEKAVELGARAIAPLDSDRSQVRLDTARAARKHEHWLRIVESACAQSGRIW